MRKLKTKTIPCLVMLFGGAVTLAITYIYHYPSKEIIGILFISLLCCYFVGRLVKAALDRIEIVDEAVENNDFEEKNEYETGELTDESGMESMGVTDLGSQAEGSEEGETELSDVENEAFFDE